MRVLLIAPDNPQLVTYPEIRDITGLSHVQVQVLNGPVSLRNVYEAVRTGKFNVIHYATHSNDQFLELSDEERLYPKDIAQIAKLADADLVFFNSCNSARHAAYLVHNGVSFAIATTVELEDKEAWKMPLAFYSYLNDQTLLDYVGAFDEAIAGDGTYILATSKLVLANATAVFGEIKALKLRIEELDRRLRIQTRWIYALLGMGVISWFIFLTHLV